MVMRIRKCVNIALRAHGPRTHMYNEQNNQIATATISSRPNVHVQGAILNVPDVRHK